MIQFKQECWAAYISTDEWHSKLFGYFMEERDAVAVSKGQGWYGGDGWAKKEVIDIRIYESRDEYHEGMISNEIEAALKKLTEKEKRLLGL